MSHHLPLRKDGGLSGQDDKRNRRAITPYDRNAMKTDPSVKESLTHQRSDNRADSGFDDRRLFHPCSDCGKPSTGEILMNVQVAGDYRYLCAACREEANLLETTFEEPCPRCNGSGTEWEGWDCDDCGGIGTSL